MNAASLNGTSVATVSGTWKVTDSTCSQVSTNDVIAVLQFENAVSFLNSGMDMTGHFDGAEIVMEGNHYQPQCNFSIATNSLSGNCGQSQGRPAQ